MIMVDGVQVGFLMIYRCMVGRAVGAGVGMGVGAALGLGVGGFGLELTL